VGRGPGRLDRGVRGRACAALGCEYDTFRDAMAHGRDAEVDASMAACRRLGRWPEREDGATLLHLAPHVGRTSAGPYVRRLLAAGLDPNAVTRDRHDPVTPLVMAARFNCAPCVESLIAAGADRHWRGPEGETLLHEAGGQTVPVLMAAGLDPHARDRQGNAPLHRRWHPAFLAVGVNATNEAGLTPLHMAALSDNLAVAEALLEAGADPALRTTRDTHWRSPGISRAFGPGIAVAKGSTALDLARQQQAASRWSSQTHAAMVKRLEALTPRRSWLSR
jgi:ankyrin repeat protein